jgi:hypothetical protein
LIVTGYSTTLSWHENRAIGPSGRATVDDGDIFDASGVHVIADPLDGVYDTAIW